MLARRRAKGRKRLTPKGTERKFAVTPKPDSGSRPAPDQRLPRSRILRLRTDFQRIKAQGKRQTGRHLVCNYLIRPEEPRLAGFVVPKACGNAVARNRIKRCLRELYRRCQASLPEHLQSVWIARKSAGAVDRAALAQDFDLLRERCGWAGKPR
ncbi:MAG: ribonuclease P protein component [Blastochloris sp.]|nr:ribonuclease P protein component [Blastochloris sp.]